MATDIRTMSRQELDALNDRARAARELRAAFAQMAEDQEADHADFIKRRTRAVEQMNLFRKEEK